VDVKTIQVVINEDLLAAIDAAAAKEAVNRSEFIRVSLRERLRQREQERLERLDREAYERIPDDPEEARFWLEKAAWPDD
jgi:metal-responsive CopG/Arc/MetJ family transcriptional regulator